MLNAQQIFEASATHIMRQQAVSLADDSGNCAYRGLFGHKCAIGILIDNDHYARSLEGRPVSDPEVLNALQESGVSTSDEEVALMKELQAIHDSEPIPFWRESLIECARDFGLQYKFLYTYGGGNR